MPKSADNAGKPKQKSTAKKAASKGAATAVKTGRPSEYDNIDLEKVRKLALKGWTDKEMYEFFGVSKTTWNRWKTEHPREFRDSLKDWKVEADAKVERSLYERATGYSHPEEKIFNHNGKPLVVQTTKHYPPDSTAMIFWLKNRKPQEWRDRRDEEPPNEDDAVAVVVD